MKRLLTGLPRKINIFRGSPDHRGAQAIQFLFTGATFASAIFIPNYLSHVFRSSDFVIGLVAFAFSFCAFVASFVFGRVADKRGRRLVLRLGLVLAALASLWQIVAGGPAALLVGRALLGVAFGMVPPALLSYAHEDGQPMGRFASLGALGLGAGWGLAGLVASLTASEASGIRFVFGLSTLMYCAAFLLTAAMDFPPHPPIEVPLLPTRIIRRSLPLYAALFIRHAGANMIWVVYAVYMEDSLRISKGLIGIVYLANALAQFVLMRVMGRLRSTLLIAIGLIASAAAFYSFTLARGFAGMLPAQLLLGLSWTGLYVGGLKYIMERNDERATATGIFQSTINISEALGPLLGGILVLTTGRVGLMYAGALAALAAAAVFAVANGYSRAGRPVS